MSKSNAAERIEAAFERAGVRRTPQRFFVLEHLLTHPEHATVEELWAALNKRHARASRATVYNTLHALVDAGLVREFTLDGKRRDTMRIWSRTIISSAKLRRRGGCRLVRIPVKPRSRSDTRAHPIL